MKKQSYASIIGIAVLILIFITGNLTFYFTYPYPVDLRTGVLLTLVNGTYLAAFLCFAYYKSTSYVSNQLLQSNMNNILYDLIQRTAQHSRTEDLYNDLLTSAVAAIPAATKGCIMLLDPISNKLNFVAVEGYDWDILKATYLDLEDSYLYRESGGHISGSVVIDDPFGYDRKHLTSDNMDEILSAGSDNVMSTISTPIIIDGQLHGMINVDSPQRHIYTEADVNLIEIFAYEIIHVIRLYDSLEMNSYLSNHDTLTGIYNRYYVNEHIIQKLTPDQRITVVSMDLNHLKGTNDTLGHKIGDRLLVQFTRGIEANRPSDSTFARYGGDEFLLFLPDGTELDVDEIMTNTINWFEHNPVTIGEFHLQVDFSYGYALYPDTSLDFNTVLHKADQFMYRHKHRQRINL